MIDFKTPRLYVREVCSSDLTSIHNLHSLPETDRYNTLGIPETIKTTETILEEWLAKQEEIPQTAYIFCIFRKEDDQFIGMIGLKLGKANYHSAEVWFKLHKDYWGMGYATEALASTLQFGFHDLKLHRIEAGCAVENIASARTMEKVGMIREGMKRKKLPIQGEWKDNYFYGILEEDFKLSHHHNV